MIKEKKCKGQGKAIGFGCGKLTKVENRVYGLGKMCGCYSDWLLNSENGKIIMAKSILKIQKPRLEFESKQVEKKELTRLKLMLNATKNKVHAFIRNRDKGLNCISCNAPYSDDFQAGHFYPAGCFETLKFHFDNIHGQCVQCNLYHSGNFENYSLNLPKRIGVERYQSLVQLAEIDKQFQKVWTVDNLTEIHKQLK
jgi:protein-arginine kinase activator protein McsA